MIDVTTIKSEAHHAGNAGDDFIDELIRLEEVESCESFSEHGYQWVKVVFIEGECDLYAATYTVVECGNFHGDTWYELEHSHDENE